LKKRKEGVKSGGRVRVLCFSQTLPRKKKQTHHKKNGPCALYEAVEGGRMTYTGEFKFRYGGGGKQGELLPKGTKCHLLLNTRGF